jgi:23S rRNA (guanosine2251-2'-O)-methyltransferase
MTAVEQRKKGPMKRASAEQPSVYGVHAVSELVSRRPLEVECIYFDQRRRTGAVFELLKTCRRQRLPYQVVPEAKLRSIAGTAKHQGVVALSPVKPYAPMESVLGELTSPSSAKLLLVPASVEDPRNLGSLLRTSAAFDVTAVLLELRNTAPLSSAVARSAAGALEHVVVARPRNLERVLGDLRNNGYRVIGTEAGASRIPQDTDLRGPTIVVVGGESRGMPAYLRKLCDEVVGIPMRGEVQSLNVSVAAAVILYECGRQRGWQTATTR